jgi:multiple antibiotic resistance protein
MLEKIICDFMTIWTTVDPITNLALFAILTAGMHRSERRRIAWRASFYAAIILVVAVIIGQIVLDAMGIRLRSLQVAGGLILFVFGLQMVFGWMNQPSTSVEKCRDLAVFPLAVPAIAGPEAIMAIILLTDNDVDSVSERAETAVVLLVMLVLNYNLTSSVRRHSADHWPTRCSSSHPGHGDHSRRACGRIHSYRFVNR